MAQSEEGGRQAIIYVLSNLTFPALEGQHVNHVLLLKAMRDAGHEVAVIALVRASNSLDATGLRAAVGGLADLAVIQTRLNYPLLLLRHLLLGVGAGVLAKSLQRMLTRWPYAVVHLEGIGMVPLVASLHRHSVVVTTTDAWSLRQCRLAARTKSWRSRMFLRTYAGTSAWVERRYFPRASAVQVVSPVDAEYLKRTVPQARIEAIPIALPSLPTARSQTGLELAGRLPTVLFWGDIRVPHIAEGLAWLLRNVLPAMVQRAQWVVLGRAGPSAELRALAPNVQYVTWVDDIDDFLRSADVVVLPDADGTGLKNRAIHAMACGVPVVGTPSAFEGFAVADEIEAMIKASAADFADAVARLLALPGLAGRMALQGRQFVVASYGTEAVSQRWQALYASVTPETVTSRP